MGKSESKYWKEVYAKTEIVGTNDLQKNVGRTVSGISVTKDIWGKTVSDIIELLAINKTMDVVELCCGNGQVIGNIADKCNKGIGVDYSDILLKQMEVNFKNRVLPIYSDVLNIAFDKETLDIVIIYFSIQHFNEKETLQLVDRSLSWLKKGGKLFIGDIPNELKKWEYMRLSSHRKDYLSRVLKGTPMIGNWFQPEFFLAMSSYFDSITIKILEQPKYQINSAYRFDVLIKKNK